MWKGEYHHALTGLPRTKLEDLADELYGNNVVLLEALEMTIETLMYVATEARSVHCAEAFTRVEKARDAIRKVKGE